jgi:hypothetical protein
MEITINVGDTVQWTWITGGHSVTSDDGLFDTGILVAGSTFSFTFDQAGDFAYHCIPHQAIGMVGVVHVLSAVAAVPAPSGLLLLGISAAGLFFPYRRWRKDLAG